MADLFVFCLLYVQINHSILIAVIFAVNSLFQAFTVFIVFICWPHLSQIMMMNHRVSSFVSVAYFASMLCACLLWCQSLAQRL